MSNEIKREEYINYLRIALALNGISCDIITAELVVENWEAIQKKGGKFSIEDSVSIEFAVRKRHQKIKTDKK